VGTVRPGMHRPPRRRRPAPDGGPGRLHDALQPTSAASLAGPTATRATV
jgi:hypothetical protein